MTRSVVWPRSHSKADGRAGAAQGRMVLQMAGQAGGKVGVPLRLPPSEAWLFFLTFLELQLLPWVPQPSPSLSALTGRLGP